MNTHDVEAFIKRIGLPIKIEMMEAGSTRTSELAAKTLGCTVAEIAKSIVFHYKVGGESKTVVVIISGGKKVSIEKLREQLGAEYVTMMRPDEVKEETGYVIGGVPPFPHRDGILVVADKSLFEFSKIWAAAGASNAIMAMQPSLLRDLLGIKIVDVGE